MGDEKHVSVNYKGLIGDLSVGDIILLNNGLMSFKVKKLSKNEALCDVIVGGVLSGKKSMSFPNKVLKQEYLSEQDKEDILFGLEHGVDFIACSFVSQKEDLRAVKAFLAEHNVENEIELIAKIENRAGVENIEEICDECSGNNDRQR